MSKILPPIFPSTTFSTLISIHPLYLYM